MHRPGEFVGQGGVDLPLARDARHAGEGGGLDQDVEMTLPTLAVAGVAGVAIGVIHHFEA
jgi:hypothetical protein